MPLTEDELRIELAWKVAAMEADIELKKAQTLKVKQDWRLDPQRVVISAFLAGAALMGAAGTILGYILGRSH